MKVAASDPAWLVLEAIALDWRSEAPGGLPRVRQDASSDVWGVIEKASTAVLL